MLSLGEIFKAAPYRTFSAARFSGATFEGGAGFGEVTFKGGAWFDEVAFKGGAWFNGATFKGGAWFNELVLPGVMASRRVIHSSYYRVFSDGNSGDWIG